MVDYFVLLIPQLGLASAVSSQCNETHERQETFNMKKIITGLLFTICLSNTFGQNNYQKDFDFYVEKYELKDKGFGLIYLDKQRCNREIFNKISTPLMHKYQVSSSVIKIRLKNLGLLQEKV